MKTIYFVRHGQTHWNVLRKLQGQKNSSLTQEGKEQTLLLQEVIQHLTIECIISSPLGRAVETSKLLLPHTPLIIDPLLREMHFGTAEGLPKEEFKERYPQEVRNLWQFAQDYVPSRYEGETFQSLEKRATQFLDKLINQKEDSIVVVAHGLILKMLFGIIQGHSLAQFWETPVPQNTSITTVLLEDSAYRIALFSDISHLKETEIISYL